MALNLNTAAEGRVDGEDANIVTEALFKTEGLVKVQDFSLEAAPQPAAAKAPAGPGPAAPGGSRPAQTKAQSPAQPPAQPQPETAENTAPAASPEDGDGKTDPTGAA
jgi:hypothetical protein